MPGSSSQMRRRWRPEALTGRQREVVAAALLLDVGWRQIDGDVHGGHLKTIVDESSLDAVVALLDSGVGQSRQVELHTT